MYEKKSSSLSKPTCATLLEGSGGKGPSAFGGRAVEGTSPEKSACIQAIPLNSMVDYTKYKNGTGKPNA